MDRTVLRRMHGIAGGLAALVIAVFLAGTVTSELIADPGLIAMVKKMIFMAIPALVLFMAATGLSGMRLCGGTVRGVVANKQKRMKIVGALGLVVLIPAAYTLYRMSASGQFDTVFYAVQAIELVAGTTNITLILLNARDGLALTRRKKGQT